MPFKGPADTLKGQFNKFTHRVSLPGGQHEIVWLVVLQDHPLTFDIIAGMAPISFGVEITKIQLFVNPQLNRGHGAGDFTRHKGFPTGWAFVIE